MTDRDSDAEPTPDEYTILPTAGLPSAEQTEPSQTESVNDATEADSEPRPRLKWYAQAAILIALASIAITLFAPIITNFFGAFRSKPIPPRATPSTTVLVKAPSSEPTGPSAYDEKFLSLMTQQGWGCTDKSSAEQCREQMVNFAHLICSYSGQSVDLIYKKVGSPAFLGPSEERRAILNAQQVYPNCRFSGNP